LKPLHLKLSTKFVLFSVVAFSIAFALIAIYFYIYIQDEEQLKVRNNTIKLFSNIAQDIQDIQNNLIKQTNFLDREELILASIYFINTYEHSKDYERPLIDEEKKEIADKLLKRAKFAFNDSIVLYAQDHSVVAGVERRGSEYIKFISTYRQNNRLYQSVSEQNSNEHYQFDKRVTKKYTPKHKLFYTDEVGGKPQITFNLIDKAIILTAHHSIFEDKVNVAHIEIAKRFDAVSLKAYHLHERLKLSTDQELEAIATDIHAISNTRVLENNGSYLAALKVPTLDGSVYIEVKQSKIDLLGIIKAGTNSFLTMLTIIGTVFILIMYLFYQVVLIKPLATLMRNVQHIKNREFKNLQELNSHDELDEIAKSIDHLARNVESKEEELQFIAEHDSLTNLYNRYHFNRIINEEIESIQMDSFLALIFIDVDEFKVINDTLGHDMGDKLLKGISKRLTTLVSNQGYLSRIGGDEFMIILPTIYTLDHLHDFAHKLHALFDDPFYIENRYLKVTISSGIVTSTDRSKSVTSLYKEADIALYKSKERGRDQFTLYEESFAQEIDERNAILTGLKYAMDHDFSELYLVYQPKISTIDSKTINGVESLIRWQSHELGLIPPDKFIPIAEESGLILDLGYWIIERSCRDFLRLQQEGMELHQISINISSIQFASKEFLDRVQEIITQTAIDPSNIEFELTERIIAHDDVDILYTLNALQKLGIQIAIDDFGTGYSSLSYLRKLPVNRIKIDKSFVTDIDKGGALDIVQSAIVPLAKALHLATTAEGVERKGEFEILKNIGVDDIQGYYFAKPMKLEEFKAFNQTLSR